MASRLDMWLLGGLRLRLDGEAWKLANSRKAQALLCYLAVSRRPHSRSSLAGLLWPDSLESSARMNLRKELWRLRPLAAHLLVGRHEVAFDDLSLHWLDVAAFERLAGARADPADLAEAAALYQGDFLAGFDVLNAPPFEEWILAQRASLRELALGALQRLVSYLADQADYEPAIAYARQLLTIEPWLEEGHRELMRLLALSGQRSAALKQFENARKVLAEELGVEPSLATLELVEQIRGGRLAEVARPAAVPPHNLPAQTTPFVGRERELALLDQLLADPATRLISILGPGGIGKTRLALAAAERLLLPQEHTARRPVVNFPDGIWFISVVGLSDPDRLPVAFAEAMGFQFNPADRAGPHAQFLNFMRGKRALLVVDNFEHLLDGAGFLADLVSVAAGVRLLATSRERLQLQGEQLLALDGLEVPEGGAVTVAALSDADSVRLFLNAAHRVQPGYTLTQVEASHLGRICRAVGGAPLAIELAAAWAAALPLSEIAAEIERNLDFLAGEARDRPARHQSIQAALEVSWQRLAPEQQSAFQRLCVFRGGFTRPAALEVAGATLPLLRQLLFKSWLAYDQIGDRYHIHELLRQYGLARLAAEPASNQAVWEAHAACFCAFLAERQDEFYGPGQLEVVEEIQAEVDNIWQAWEFAIRQGDVDKISESLRGLFRFCYWRGWIADGAAAAEKAARMLAELIQASPASLAELLRLQACMLMWQSEFLLDNRPTEPLLDQAAALLDAAEASDVEVRPERALWLRAMAEEKIKRDAQHAFPFAQRALALYQELNDQLGIGWALYSLAGAERWRGDYEAAAGHLQAVLKLSRYRQDRLSAVWAYAQLGIVRKYQGRLDEAEQLDHQAMALCVALRLPADESYVIGNHAHTLFWHGKFEQALAMARRSLAISEALGWVTHWPLATLAYPLPHLGRYAEARAALLAAVSSARSSAMPWTLGMTLEGLAKVGLVEGDFAQAEVNLEESRSVLLDGGYMAPGATPLIIRAYLRRQQGETETAARQLSKGLSEVLVTPQFITVLETLPIAALLAADRGDLERAAELHALSQTFPYITNSRWFYDVAGRELEDIVARLPAEAAQAAMERGRKLDLWATAEALAAELTPA